MKVFTRTDAHSRGRISKSHIAKVLSVIVVSSIVLASMTVEALADTNQRWNLGSATNTGKDNGFSGTNTIDRDDPHYGWSLGQFYVSGYTQRTTDTDGDVFLKNVGDQVELHFELLQDIDCLNDNPNLSIYADENGYDQYFSTQQFNDCRGLLIIRKIDYQNATADPVIYTDYLDGVAQGADTVVELCEEGDYEVALDYEIKEDHYGASWNTYVSVPTYTNYRIFFTFKIRNGNCMVFPFDCVTGSELQNESFTDNGFYLDLANSRYLEINVQRAVYVEGANGYTEDIRFNRPASDGTEYVDEGVYTITVHNNYTNQNTEKVIYVGTDPIMRAYVVTGYTLEEIQSYLDAGYEISENGTLIAPAVDEPEVEVINSDEAIATEIAPSEELISDSDSESATAQELKVSQSEVKKSSAPIVIVIIIFLLAGAGAFGYLKKDFLLGLIKGNKASNSSLSSSVVGDSSERISENTNEENDISMLTEDAPAEFENDESNTEESIADERLDVTKEEENDD